tara:strand:+ start:1654 stop:1863 length:210 start_codon:yes stop_codon:yes gene_type:complete
MPPPHPPRPIDLMDQKINEMKGQMTIMTCEIQSLKEQLRYLKERNEEYVEITQKKDNQTEIATAKGWFW